MAVNIKDDISEYYSETSHAVDEILKKLKEANSQHDADLQRRIDEVVKSIEEKNIEFKAAVDALEKDSEFDKFSIAFFGATNAGKSTIIESLRILFDEQSRKESLKKNGEKCVKVKKQYNERYAEVISNLEQLKKVYSPKSKFITISVYVLILIIGIISGYLLAGVI